MGRLFITLLLCFGAIASTVRAQCWDGIWSPCEFCGHDAYLAVGETEMNHDCVVDMIDFGLFAQDFGNSGMLSGDFSGDGVVNGQDLAIFAFSFLQNGGQVAPCDTCNVQPVGCDGRVRVTFDFANLTDVDEITLDPYVPAPLAIVSQGTQGMATYAGAVSTSTNVVVIGWEGNGSLPLGEHGTAFLPPIATNDPVLLFFGQFYVTDTEPAFIQPCETSYPNAPLGWTTLSPPQRYEFSAIAGGGVNGPPPAVYSNCAPTGVPEAEVVSRIWAFPNPTAGAVYFGLPSSWRPDAQLGVRVYNVSGARIRSFEARAANQIVSWDGNAHDGLRAPAGVYLVTFKDGNRTIKTKVTLTR